MSRAEVVHLQAHCSLSHRAAQVQVERVVQGAQQHLANVACRHRSVLKAKVLGGRRATRSGIQDDTANDGRALRHGGSPSHQFWALTTASNREMNCRISAGGRQAGKAGMDWIIEVRRWSLPSRCGGQHSGSARVVCDHESHETSSPPAQRLQGLRAIGIRCTMLTHPRGQCLGRRRGPTTVRKGSVTSGTTPSQPRLGNRC